MNKNLSLSVFSKSSLNRQTLGILIQGDMLYHCQWDTKTQSEQIMIYHIENPDKVSIESLTGVDIQNIDKTLQLSTNNITSTETALEEIFVLLPTPLDKTQVLSFDFSHTVKTSEINEQQSEFIDHFINEVIALNYETQQPIEKALYLLPQLENPLEIYQQTNDPDFQTLIQDNVSQFISMYNQSHWYSPWLNSLGNILTGEITQLSSDESLKLGKTLLALTLENPTFMNAQPLDPSPITAPVLEWDKVFPGGCHSKKMHEGDFSHPLKSELPEQSVESLISYL